MINQFSKNGIAANDILAIVCTTQGDYDVKTLTHNSIEDKESSLTSFCTVIDRCKYEFSFIFFFFSSSTYNRLDTMDNIRQFDSIWNSSKVRFPKIIKFPRKCKPATFSAAFVGPKKKEEKIFTDEIEHRENSFEFWERLGNVISKFHFIYRTHTRVHQLSLMLVETILNRLRLVSKIDCMQRQ